MSSHSPHTRPGPTAERPQEDRPQRRRWHFALLAVPFVWCLLGAPWANTVGVVFGAIPFLLVWMIAGVVLGSVCIGIVYEIDRRNGDLERI